MKKLFALFLVVSILFAGCGRSPVALGSFSFNGEVLKLYGSANLILISEPSSTVFKDFTGKDIATVPSDFSYAGTTEDNLYAVFVNYEKGKFSIFDIMKKDWYVNAEAVFDIIKIDKAVINSVRIIQNQILFTTKNTASAFSQTLQQNGFMAGGYVIIYDIHGKYFEFLPVVLSTLQKDTVISINVLFYNQNQLITFNSYDDKRIIQSFSFDTGYSSVVNSLQNFASPNVFVDVLHIPIQLVPYLTEQTIGRGNINQLSTFILNKNTVSCKLQNVYSIIDGDLIMLYGQEVSTIKMVVFGKDNQKILDEVVDTKPIFVNGILFYVSNGKVMQYSKSSKVLVALKGYKVISLDFSDGLLYVAEQKDNTVKIISQKVNTVDSMGPVINVSSPVNGTLFTSNTDKANFAVSGKVYDLLSGIASLTINGTNAIVDPDGVFTFEMKIPLKSANPSFQIKIDVVDKTGNKTEMILQVKT